MDLAGGGGNPPSSSPFVYRHSESVFHPPSRNNTMNVNQSESIFYRKYRDKPRMPLSQASFYKSCQSGSASSSLIKKSYAEGSSSSSSSTSFYSFGASSSTAAGTYEREKRDAIRKIITFLSFKNYPHDLNPKLLSSPSRKDVVEIWAFLFKQIDSHTEITPSNANDEIPRLFRETGYPITISRSSMVAPGAAHQWSQHLSAISWLCELLIYEEEAFPNILNSDMFDSPAALPDALGDGHNSENSTSALSVLNKIIVEKYKIFLAGEESIDSLRSAVLTRLEENINELRENIGNKNRALAKLQNNLAEIQAEFRQSEQMKVRNGTLVEETKTLKTHLAAAEDASTELDMAIKIEKQKHEEKTAKMKALDEETNRVKEQIAKQGISREEVQALLQDVAKKKEVFNGLCREIKDSERQLADLRDKLQGELSEVQTAAKNCNNLIKEIKETTKKTKMKNCNKWEEVKTFQIATDRLDTLQNFLGLDWKKNKSEVQELIADDEKEEKNLKSEIPTLKMSLEDAKKRCREKKEEIARLEKQEKDEWAKLKHLEKDNEVQYEDILDECARIKTSADCQVEEKENELRDARNKLNQKHKLLMQIKENNEKINKQKKARYGAIMREIFSTKGFVINQLTQWDEYTKQSCAEVMDRLQEIMAEDE